MRVTGSNQYWYSPFTGDPHQFVWVGYKYPIWCGILTEYAQNLPRHWIQKLKASLFFCMPTKLKNLAWNVPDLRYQTSKLSRQWLHYPSQMIYIKSQEMTWSNGPASLIPFVCLFDCLFACFLNPFIVNETSTGSHKKKSHRGVTLCVYLGRHFAWRTLQCFNIWKGASLAWFCFDLKRNDALKVFLKLTEVH